MINKEIYDFENNRLKRVIDNINEQIKVAKKNLSEQEHFIIGFKEGQRGTQFTRQSLMSFYATEVSNLESIVNNPYFGRFEFKNNNDGKTDIIYIGKKNIVGTNGENVAYDWRSPICSMYYDYNVGPSQYINNYGPDYSRGFYDNNGWGIHNQYYGSGAGVHILD